jgi:hypothetical protein
MAFMQQEITGKRVWLEIDGNQGITFVDMADVESPLDVILADGTDNEDGHLTDLFGSLYEGDIDIVKMTTGFGARMSAPGYMDCTEWAVFDTEAEAKSYLDEDNLFYEDETVG